MTWRALTVEPLIFQYTVATDLLDFIVKNQMSLRDGSYVTDNLMLIDHLKPLYYWMFIFVNVILSTTLMCWSDKAGRRRRPLMVLPIIGVILRMCTGLLPTHYFLDVDSSINAVFCDLIFELITGGPLLMTMACLTYLCDQNIHANRTTKMGWFFALKILGDVFAFGIAHIFIYEQSYVVPYGICFIMTVLSLFLIFTDVKGVQDVGIVKPPFYQVFNLSEIGKSFRVVFKDNLGEFRIVAFFLITVAFLSAIADGGEISVEDKFFQKLLYWDFHIFRVWVPVRNIIKIIGITFCSIFLSKLKKWHDSLIGVFAGMCGVVGSLIYLFAISEDDVFWASAINLLSFFMIPASISSLSKLYRNDELGHLCAVFGVLMLLAPGGPHFYKFIFSKTSECLPSAFFSLSVSIRGICVVLFGVSFFIHKNFTVPDLPERTTDVDSSRAIKYEVMRDQFYFL